MIEGETRDGDEQFVKSERLRKLPPYLFAEIDKKKKAAIAAGRDVINLGVGDPDRPTPPSDDTPVKVLRRGTLSCSATTGKCSFLLTLPDDVRTVD